VPAPEESVSDDPTNIQKPAARGVAARAIARSVITSAKLLGHRRTHLPKRNVGLRLHFADGTSGRVFRETILDRPRPDEPCILVVEFRLRLLRGRWHVFFLWECILNTPLFVGFPGFVSKLWVDRDEKERYRGVYEWDGSARARCYAQALWRVLELVCRRDAIGYWVVPGLTRDDVLQDPARMDPVASNGTVSDWWRLVNVEP
jgi:hypothetical protein